MTEEARLSEDGETASASAGPYLYTAFASYASGLDSRVTEDVERFLEGLHVNALVPDRYRRQLKVCRDASDFPFLARLTLGVRTPENSLRLVEVVKGFLLGSEHLLVFARPESRTHPWVVKELDLWIEERGPTNIVICLTGGDPALPKAAYPQGILDHDLQHQLHVDLRGFGRANDRRYTGRSYEEELLRLAARLLGPGTAPNDLIAGWHANAAASAARAKKARLRRRLLMTVVVGVVATVAGVATDRAHRKSVAIQYASAALDADLPATTGLMLALQAYPDAPEQALPLIQARVATSAPRAWALRQPTDVRYEDIPTPVRPLPELVFRPDNALVVARSGTVPQLVRPRSGTASLLPDWTGPPQALAGWRNIVASPSRRFAAGTRDAAMRVVDRASPLPPADFASPRDFVAERLAVSSDGSGVAGLDAAGRVWGSGGSAATPCPFLPPDAADRGALLVAPEAAYVATDYQLPCGDDTCRRVVVVRPSDCKLAFDRRYREGDVRALAIASERGGASRLVLGTRSEVRAIPLGSDDPERSVAMKDDRALLVPSPDGRFLATAGRSGQILVLALADLRTVAVVPGYADNDGIAFSPDGTTLAVAGFEDDAYRTSASRIDLTPDYARERWRGQGAGGPIDWAHDGTRLAIAGPGGVTVLDPVTGAPERRLELPACLTGGSIQDVYGPAADGSISALYMPREVVKWAADGGAGTCRALASSAGRPRDARIIDGDRLAVLTDRRLVGLSLQDANASCPNEPAGSRLRMAASRRGRVLAWFDDDGKADLGKKLTLRTLSLDDCQRRDIDVSLPVKTSSALRSVRDLKLSEDGTKLVLLTGEGETGHLASWARNRSSRWSATFQAATPKRYDEVALSPDGRHVAARASDSIDVLDVERGRWLYAFGTGNVDAMSSANTLSFSPDGAYLAASFPTAAPLVRVIDERRLVSDACRRLPDELRPKGPCD